MTRMRVAPYRGLVKGPRSGRTLRRPAHYRCGVARLFRVSIKVAIVGGVVAVVVKVLQSRSHPAPVVDRNAYNSWEPLSDTTPVAPGTAAAEPEPEPPAASNGAAAKAPDAPDAPDTKTAAAEKAAAEKRAAKKAAPKKAAAAKKSPAKKSAAKKAPAKKSAAKNANDEPPAESD